MLDTTQPCLDCAVQSWTVIAESQTELDRHCQALSRTSQTETWLWELWVCGKLSSAVQCCPDQSGFADGGSAFIYKQALYLQKGVASQSAPFLLYWEIITLSETHTHFRVCFSSIICFFDQAAVNPFECIYIIGVILGWDHPLIR